MTAADATGGSPAPGGAPGPEVDPEQLAMRAEEVRGHLEVVSRQLEVFTAHREDKDQALATLKGLKESRPGDEVLFPVGGNTFITAQLGENEQVVVGVGADYAMPRAIDKAVETLEQDLARLQDEVASLSTTAMRLEAEYTQLVQVLQSLRAAPSRTR